MGALHEGHLALIKKAKKENDLVVCSIFVNPTQFNNKEDLAKYPRDLKKDIEFLESVNCDILFVPNEKEMYPEDEKEKLLKLDFGNLDKIMEGKFRPGHFIGVATIVNKLFRIVEPDKAYFGEKDYQQLIIIKKMVEKLKQPIQIIPCSIKREKDGLAMSSRNARLTKEERKAAPFIYMLLKEAEKFYPVLSPSKIKNLVEKRFSENKNFILEYFEIVDSSTLISLNKWEKMQNPIACIAAHLGKVRLIDNIKMQ